MAPSKLLAYLRLLRLPNVFTAIADVSMGLLFAQGVSGPLETFLCLLAASSLLYLAGMVLNDVFDLEVDRQERPERPLPSGQIPLGFAKALGWGLLTLGLVAGVAAGWVAPLENSLPWRSGAVA